MTEVKWIKIVTDIFDDEKMLLIDGLPEHDAIIVIWFKLLCLAGKQNNGGVFMISDKIAYTDEMLATIFHRPLNTVRLALGVFEKYGMIEIIDDTITIANWNKHQALDAYEKKKQRDRLYQAKAREKQRALLCGKSSDNRLTSQKIVSAEEEEERDIERDIEREREEIREKKEKTEAADAALPAADPVPYSEIVGLYHTICLSYPRLRSTGQNRRKAIAARWKEYGQSLDAFRELFERAEASLFLKGRNGRNWTADFDWLLNGGNMAKVLEGKYGEERSAPAARPFRDGGTMEVLAGIIAQEEGGGADDQS